MKNITSKDTKQVSGAGIVKDAVISVVAEKVVTGVGTVVVEKVKETGQNARAWEAKNKKDEAAWVSLTSC